MPVPGSQGVIYGGPNLDILFVLSAGLIVDFYTGQTGYIVSERSSLFAITGVGRTFDQVSTRLNVF